MTEHSDHRHPAHAVLVQALAPRLTPEQTAHRRGAEHLAHEAVIALNTAGLLRTSSDLAGHLEGATERPGEGERASTPGQFAALWNGMTPHARQTLLDLLRRNGDDALRCYLEKHDDELLDARGRLTAVLALHVPEQPWPGMVPKPPECEGCRAECQHCDGDHPWPCPTARAAGVQPSDLTAEQPSDLTAEQPSDLTAEQPSDLTAEQMVEARRIRAWVDEAVPRVLPDDSINTQHVAIEITRREREGLPHYIAELDGPGKYRP